MCVQGIGHRLDQIKAELQAFALTGAADAIIDAARICSAKLGR